MDVVYFANNIIIPLASLCYPQGKRSHGRKVVLYIDNASMHNAKLMTERILSEGLGRMSHLPYSPNLASCDFFLCEYVKEKLITAQCQTLESLPFKKRQIIADILGNILQECIKFRFCMKLHYSPIL
jgi:hypothetical protein